MTLFFLFLHANSLNAPFERDEGNYAYGAWLLTQGACPYVDTLEQKPPLIYFPYLLAWLIAPAAYWPIRLLAALALAGTTLLIWLIVKREYGDRAALVAAWLTPPMVLFPHLAPFAANTEKFLILPLYGLLAIYVLNRDNDNWQPWFWAGICGASAVLFKQIGAGPVAFIFLVWLAEQRRNNWRQKGGAAAAGGLLTIILVTGYFVLAGGLPAFWEATVYNQHYIRSTGGVTLHWLKWHLQEFWAGWPALCLLLFWYLVSRPARWWVYGGMLLVMLATVFPSPYGHYYIMLMPLWAIMAAVALTGLSQLLSRVIKHPDWELWLVIGATALLIASMLGPISSYFTCSPNELVTRIYGRHNPFVEAPLAAARVAELTGPDDKIFVAGSEQQIYYYAKRRAVGRFSGTYGMMIDNPANLRYQQETAAALAADPPAAIVWVFSPRSWLVNPRSPRWIFRYLESELAKNYRLVGGTVRRDFAAEWREPLTDKELTECSLLVYLRKKGAQ